MSAHPESTATAHRTVIQVFMGETLPTPARGCQGGVTLDEMSHLEAAKTINFAAG